LRNLDFSEFVLDASAFYAGTPFLSSSTCYTTNLVLKEVIHIKKSYSALESLIDAGNLKIIDPEEQFLKKIIKIARKTGDFSKLSSADLSILSLALQLKATLISDDYAIINIAILLRIPIKTIATKGITKVRKWVTFCKACGKAYSPDISECMLCGNKLKRRFKILSKQVKHV
jgi:endoribonuclease Nob1